MVLFFEQGFKPGAVCFVKVSDIGVNKISKNEIQFFDAPVPGTKEKTASAVFQGKLGVRVVGSGSGHIFGLFPDLGGLAGCAP